MTEVVLDASVIVKWVFPDRPGETHAERAMEVLRAIQAGRLSIVEPPHWLAEVAAVVTRLAPEQATEVIGLLHAMEFPVLGHPVPRRGAPPAGRLHADRRRALLPARTAPWIGCCSSAISSYRPDEPRIRILACRP